MKKLLVLTTLLALTASTAGCHCLDRLWRGAPEQCPQPGYGSPCAPACSPCDPCAAPGPCATGACGPGPEAGY
jgi:hypothetical protein